MILDRRFSFLFSFVIILFVILACCRSGFNQEEILSLEKSETDEEFISEKIALGKQLFFDKRLSRTNSISCASCHVPAFAFTDRKSLSEGVDGRKTTRNSPSILNAKFLKTVMFDAHINSLEQQVIVPIQEHQEMDMKMGELIQKLKSIPEYSEAAKKYYGREFDPFVLTRSIAAFERTLTSMNSRFDKYIKGEESQLSNEEIKGYKLFSEKLYCTQCHLVGHFTTFNAENNGLYRDYKLDKGRFRIFNDTNDIGKFKVPSLRNIELTFPYMHDGSLASLEDVILHYERGGKGHLNQSKIIQPFRLSSKEKKQLILFLKSLTDTSYMAEYRSTNQ
ncbi:MAG: cytochrome-c peroxidase [Flavobacteriia bacterium]|jgi:cytochrome c peroxidase